MPRGIEYCDSRLKRRWDVAVASGSLPATSPLWLAMYCYNKLRGQPLFFKQERIGKDNQKFLMIKFETLYKGAENDGYQSKAIHLPHLEKERCDPRTTSKILALMRRSGLNEIPQLINVLKGEMSIVGPRPLPPYVIQEVEEMFPELVRHWTEVALRVKPGMVGTSPLITRNLPVEQFEQTALTDIKYVETATFFGDLSIMAQAIIATTK